MRGKERGGRERESESVWEGEGVGEGRAGGCAGVREEGGRG